MADDKPPQDPAAAFGQNVAEWERSVNKFFNDMMGTEQFSQSMNQMQRMQLEFQNTFRDGMSQYLLNMNMPSRDDLMQMGETVRAIDDRLGRLEQKLDLILGQGTRTSPAKPKGPPRTRKPPKAKEA